MVLFARHEWTWLALLKYPQVSSFTNLDVVIKLNQFKSQIGNYIKNILARYELFNKLFIITITKTETYCISKVVEDMVYK